MAAESAFADVPIDRVREFWNARPCNIGHSPREVGSREYFDDVERRKYFVEPHIPAFADFARWSGRQVLEIGYGLGTDTVNFARAGARVSYKLFSIMRDEGIWDMSRVDELMARSSEAQTGCPVTYTYTDRTIRELLAGLRLLDVRKAHIFTWDIEPYRQYEYRKAREWANVSEQELAELETELGWHMLVRAVLGEPPRVLHE